MWPKIEEAKVLDSNALHSWQGKEEPERTMEKAYGEIEEGFVLEGNTAKPRVSRLVLLLGQVTLAVWF